MKKISKYMAVSAVVMAAGLQSCSLDEPFGNGGEGNLYISTEINGDIKSSTRALSGDELTTLRENCVVYIENSRGVMRKFKGVNNIPGNIRLSAGEYVCNAWSGDSVGASFDKKFYRNDSQTFTITANQEKALTVTCNIANVVVSVDAASAGVGLTDMKVMFSTTRGDLEFAAADFGAKKGYFMTPSPQVKAKDEAKYAENTTLKIKVTGTAEDGSAYAKDFKVENIQRGHEYKAKVSKDASVISDGGALISLTVLDIPLVEETVDVFAAPQMSGIGFNIAEPVNSIGAPADIKVAIRAYYGLKSASMNLGNGFQNTGTEGEFNLLTQADELKAKGISIDRTDKVKDAETGVDVELLYVTLSKAYLAGLPDRNDMFKVTFNAEDAEGRASEKSLEFYNTQAASPDPITANGTPDSNKDPMAILGTSATLQAVLADATATSYGFDYRVAGSEGEWTRVPYTEAKGARRHGPTRATGGKKEFSVTITGLTTGTTYEYRVFADEFVSEKVQTFTTESKFTIDNASMEEWSTYTAKLFVGTGSVVLPSGTGDKTTSFWGSGNEGAATVKETLTDKSTDMVHSGTYSARMESKKVVAGMIAAGNLFVGEYVKTDGTNGVLSMGRPYNGSHPTKLRVYVNYRPGTNVSIKDGNESMVELTNGGKDHGQIYVALSNGAVDIRTNPSDQKLFNKDDEQILAYGQVTWKDNFGPDGQLAVVEIPFVYNDRAKTVKPTHLVITCCASKFGDFFSGSAGSVMYVDDFELVYE